MYTVDVVGVVGWVTVGAVVVVVGVASEVSSENVKGSVEIGSVTNGGLKVDGWRVLEDDGLVGRLWRAVERSGINWNNFS